MSPQTIIWSKKKNCLSLSIILLDFTKKNHNECVGGPIFPKKYIAHLWYMTNNWSKFQGIWINPFSDIVYTKNTKVSPSLCFAQTIIYGLYMSTIQNHYNAYPWYSYTNSIQYDTIQYNTYLLYRYKLHKIQYQSIMLQLYQFQQATSSLAETNKGKLGSQK